MEDHELTDNISAFLLQFTGTGDFGEVVMSPSKNDGKDMSSRAIAVSCGYAFVGRAGEG